MSTIRRSFHNLGIDGWIIGLSGLSALIFALVSLFGVVPYDQETTMSILLGAVGLLMAAVVARTARRNAEIADLRSALGVADSQMLFGSREFRRHLVPSVLTAKHVVWDSHLTWAIPQVNYPQQFSGSYATYDRMLRKRVSKDELSYKYVTIVYHKQCLEDVLCRLLAHQGYRYYIRHYRPSSSIPIPIINVMSFDGQDFYLGGFHTRQTPGETEMLHIREQNLTELLKKYWNVLWEGAVPLNEGGIINWGELRSIALELGMTDKEFDSTVLQVRDVLHEKSLLRGGVPASLMPTNN